MVTKISPVTGDRKFMSKHDDDLDWEDSNSSSSHGQRTYPKEIPTDQLTRNNPLMARNTRSNVNRPTTVLGDQVPVESEMKKFKRTY